MQVKATLRQVRVSAQKCRLVADQIRGQRVDRALALLSFSPRRAASIVKKVLESAIANAEHNAGADVDELRVSRVFVDQGPVYKRFRARAKGRGARILKRTSHVTVAVSDDEA